ncbi:hypothetical protein JN531_012060 [Flagellatimonas centrodinii]|uniref:hypothetical protein n=1 Tax=Flagellatimonas centrodinii TaxID=2806210 RepID=UPI001FED733C|nr:hypothetical protein [Flagellatimonas centrodinii]ULQ45834.1 hypothetical protein JN531_012060 [Flagellatimonas centrodinii]
MKQYRVWCPDHGQCYADAKQIFADSFTEAAQTWAKWRDATTTEYAIANGEPATVQVHDCKTGRCLTMIVQGDAAPTYRARLKIEPSPAHAERKP